MLNIGPSSQLHFFFFFKCCFCVSPASFTFHIFLQSVSANILADADARSSATIPQVACWLSEICEASELSTSFRPMKCQGYLKALGSTSVSYWD